MMMPTQDTTDLFEPALTYPDVDARERLMCLVGLDDHRDRLTKILSVLVDPVSLADWFRQHHGDGTQLLELIRRRPPLVILAGDVGSGKTELAETIGDAVARQNVVNVTLLPLSLASRGQGRVGEMTSLLGRAFDRTIKEARALTGNGPASGAVILLVDEADALAQSREAAQMHHEDRAGVNAFIRGVDRMASLGIPAAVIMCTNRLGALDPAIRRRAADILIFRRPTDAQRRDVLHRALQPLGFGDTELDQIVEATGARNGHGYGFTFSDLTQRLLPAVVLDAYPVGPVRPERAIEIVREMRPTPPFEDPEGWSNPVAENGRRRSGLSGPDPVKAMAGAPSRDSD